MKAFPTEALTHAPISCVLDLVKDNDLQPDQIKEIHIRSLARAADILADPSKYDPRTKETADHSLPYIFARALLDGPITVASFDEEAVRAPALRPLMAKITVTADADIEAMLPDHMAVRVSVRMRDGTTHEVEVIDPLGHPNNPMQVSDIEKKFIAQGEPAIGAERCRAALDAWWRVQDAADLRPLIALLDI